MHLQPYVFFNGRCQEAVDFYKQAIGAEVETLMRFKDAPDQSMVPPGSADKIMHCSLRIGDTTLLASDGQSDKQPAFDGFALTITAENEAKVDRLFDALGQGGEVRMAPAETFFSPRFAMLTDKFGVHWMLLAEKK